MAYELHIERDDGSISLEEWATAVSKIENLQLSSSAPATTNPKTGEVIKLSIKPDTIAEIYSPKEKKWNVAFRLANGKISFRPQNLAKKDDDYVWLTAIRIASILSANIHGDNGETYDLKTGKSTKTNNLVKKHSSHSKEAIKFIFTLNQDVVITAMTIKDFLDQRGLAEKSYVLYGKQISSDKVLTEIKKRQSGGFLLEGENFSFSFSSIANDHLSFLEIVLNAELHVEWDEWADLFISTPNFVMAWIMDLEYDHWQNAEDLLEYTSASRPYAHLPKKSNGLPFPLERQIIDISKNPGRWSFQHGYIEAVGSIMWLGDAFWRLTGAKKSTVASSAWLQASTPIPSIVRLQVADRAFTTGSGESGTLQRKLRGLLYGKS